MGLNVSVVIIFLPLFFLHEQGFNNGTATCSKGYFGAQCEFECHCHDEGECDQVTGECRNQMCAYGWGGSDCQQGMYAQHIEELKELAENVNYQQLVLNR